MAIKPGSVNDFSNSMAEAIENALKSEYQAVKGQALPQGGEEDRRLLFVAIARGVVKYLKDNADSSILVHNVSVNQVSSQQITSQGSHGAETIHVTQDSGSGNRVQSANGVGKVKIETSGV